MVQLRKGKVEDGIDSVEEKKCRVMKEKSNSEKISKTKVKSSEEEEKSAKVKDVSRDRKPAESCETCQK